MDRGKENCSTFGDAVRRARAKTGLTQEELADRSGIDRSYIGGVERGERNPTLVVICKIADGLGLTLSELFSYDNARGSRD
ncbi:helix-turn-helix domain-containing protein [Paracraurococcus ruber]|uniref:Transcriptional regulator n=1 Tax=Paracraurococcus ruber TaxID=77675 RepID=A0ABS1CZA0_9PROT|nr:transcriptional regulator [Paracraurococcus ruber]TDG28958.1 XRE family transcriptional regulator [Paracraurococcus ruber]